MGSVRCEVLRLLKMTRASFAWEGCGMFRGVGGETLIQVGGCAALQAGDLRGHMGGFRKSGVPF